MQSRSNARTYGFVIISILTHVALATGIMIYHTQSEPKKKETAQVDVVAQESAPESAPAPSTEEESQAPVEAPMAQEAEAPKAKVASKPLPPKPIVATAAPVKAPPKAPKVLPPAKQIAEPDQAAVTEETPTQEDSPVAVPVAETSENSEEPKSEVKTENVAEATPAVATEEVTQEADEPAKQEEEKPVAAQKEAPVAEETPVSQDEALAAAAAERMAQEAQASREAEQARQAEAAQKAEEARVAEQAKAQAIVDGKSAGNVGNGTAETGTPTGNGTGDGDVRALSDLRQVPGNKRPLYDHEDRLKGRQGEVSFLAYVSKEGSLTEFKMVQSSGHRELDAKTLKALKTWKFYPGQEGWVEIPFKWDLQGGPQEMPTTLRRRAQVSQSQNN